MVVRRFLVAALIILQVVNIPATAQDHFVISKEEFRNKIQGFWLGQLVGNYMGFPFEFVYNDEPIPVLVDRYYYATEGSDLRMNSNDRRANLHIMANALDGAWSDDDTDIELVTLTAVEEYGLDLTYEEIAAEWKDHINRFIWVSNRKARDLMDEGLVPPATGNKENNPYWYAIDPQLVNEIWSAFYPGMITKAVKRAEWGARITSDDWGVHPTMFYGALYSAAFFENDVNKLYQIGLDQIPQSSIFNKGLEDVRRWYNENKDWRTTRKLIYETYWQYPEVFENPFFNHVSALVNGLCGAMAILYGQGDFVKTTAIAVSAGFDCDNQAATCAGLMGVINGADSIPEEFTLSLGQEEPWDEPFNNQYINYSRDGLPNMIPISEIIDRIVKVSEQAIIEGGGGEIIHNGVPSYRISIN